MSQLSEFLSTNHNKNIEELKELLRIQSISSLSVHKEDIQKDSRTNIAARNKQPYFTRGYPSNKAM